jgi:hypothetical protein
LASLAAELHMVIGEARHRGLACGTEAARLILDYAFTALGLVSVMLTVTEFNHWGIARVREDESPSRSDGPAWW